MPALRVLGQRLNFIAGDDLRAFSKAVILLRIAQVAVLVPAVVLLAQTKRRFDDLHADGDPMSPSSCVKDRRQKKAIVWSFWVLSATTIASSIVLESFM